MQGQSWRALNLIYHYVAIMELKDLQRICLVYFRWSDLDSDRMTLLLSMISIYFQIYLCLKLS